MTNRKSKSIYFPVVDPASPEHLERKKRGAEVIARLEKNEKELEINAAEYFRNNPYSNANSQGAGNYICRLPSKWDDLNYNSPSLQDRSLQTSCAATTEPVKMVYVLPNWLPQGIQTTLGGASAIGKSQIVCNVAARVTNGGSHPSWPDPTAAGWGYVIIISSEDDFARIILPRLMAAEANLERVHHVDGIRRYSNVTKPFSFSDEDIESLAAFAEKVVYVGLIIVELASLAVEGDARNNQNVQQGYKKLDQLAKRFDCAVITIMHEARNVKGKALLSRFPGAMAMTTAPRNIWYAREIEGGSTDTDATHVLVRAKATSGNLEGGYLYSIKGAEVTRKDGTVIKTSKIVWHGDIPGKSSDIIKWAESGEMLGTKIDPLDVAVKFIKELLRNGPVLVGEVEKQAKAAVITTRALKAAKKTLGIKPIKLKGAGQASPWVWCFPGDEPK